MATTPHIVIKPEKLVATAVGILEREAVLPRLIAREGVDKYRGADNDTISYVVPGTLPYRVYGWRNDRSNPLTLDRYTERKISVSFGGNVYSALEIIDEQVDFDGVTASKLLPIQAKAVTEGLTRMIRDEMVDANYEVTIGNVGQSPRSGIIEARRVLNAFHAPQGNRVLLVGTEFESLLLNDDKLNLASAVGDRIAESKLTEATLGRQAGFTIVVDQDIPADTAFAFADSAFFLATGAPSVPRGVPFGATVSYNGFALRWMQDYDTMFLRDRSVVNTYAGVSTVKDPLAAWDGDRQVQVSDSQYLMRAVKLTLDGSSNYPAASGELAEFTGISDARVWTPTGYGAETDVTNPGPNNA